MMWLIAQRQLLPGVVLIGSFMLFVLWVTGLVELGIQLFGPSNSVNSLCNNYINNMAQTGVSLNTLAWIAQKNICKPVCCCYNWVELTGDRQLLGGGLCVPDGRQPVPAVDDAHVVPSQ